MSEYRDFSKCVLCRTIRNYENYRGEFNITALISTLHMTLINAFENKLINDNDLRKWLDDNSVTKICAPDEKTVSNEQYSRNLRNGLAHLQILVPLPNSIPEQSKSPIENKIENIVIYTSYRGGLDKELKTFDELFHFNDGVKKVEDLISTFTFTENSLKDLIYFLEKETISSISLCNECKYKRSEVSSNE